MPSTRPIPDRQVFSVSQLNRSAKELLETYLPLLWVEGELSNITRASSGHWYFTLKDSQAQVRCAMFKNRNMSVRFKPDNGDKVLVRGKISLYEGRGDYQLIAEHMEPAGAGDLQKQFELIKQRLEAEGLFETSRKRPLPKWPNRLGIITSPTGAVVHDIMQVLARRFPSLPILLLPVAVQGNEAAGQIVQAIRTANKNALCDVLIVGRGGGSLEDLWAFNEESVARAIAESTIPIISAVGHEVDFTIADFVADLRAPTPSAAAELVSPNGLELLQQISRYRKQLLQQIKQVLAIKRHLLTHQTGRLRHPGERLKQKAQAVDLLEMRLKRAWGHVFSGYDKRLINLQNRLSQQRPNTLLQEKRQSVRFLHHRLHAAQRSLIAAKTNQFQQALNLLSNLSPLNTLQRGYAIVTDQKNRVVRSWKDVKPGDHIKTQVKEGTLIAKVIEVSDDQPMTPPPLK